MSPKKILRGDIGEKIAYEFLLKEGLTLLFQRFKSPFGEIDLIMESQNHIHFVEVKLRKSTFWGQAHEVLSRINKREYH